MRKWQPSTSNTSAQACTFWSRCRESSYTSIDQQASRSSSPLLNKRERESLTAVVVGSSSGTSGHVHTHARTHTHTRSYTRNNEDWHRHTSEHGSGPAAAAATTRRAGEKERSDTDTRLSTTIGQGNHELDSYFCVFSPVRSRCLRGFGGFLRFIEHAEGSSERSLEEDSGDGRWEKEKEKALLSARSFLLRKDAGASMVQVGQQRTRSHAAPFERRWLRGDRTC